MSIITLQCGEYANYVGSHFWNFQEFEFEYGNDAKVKPSPLNTVDHDVLYREGLTLDRQVTYTPRLVAIDLKGSLGTLPELGDLYHKPTVPKLGSLNWRGDTQVLKQEPSQKNEFLKELCTNENIDNEKDMDDVMGYSGQQSKESSQNYSLDDQVNFWSDYLYSRFHPKSVLVVESYQHQNTTHPFDMFGLGEALWTDHHQDVGDQIEDRIRFFAEECDNLQGFHLLSDLHSGFGGLASKISHLLADDYSSKGLLNLPVMPPTLSDYNFNSCNGRLANTALSISSLIDNGLVTPLSLASEWFPLRGRYRSLQNIEYKPDLLYHSSAILASVIDTMTMVYRQKDKTAHLNDVISGLSSDHRNFAAVSASLPLDFTGDSSFEKDIFSKPTALIPSSISKRDQSSDSYTSLFTLRGLLKSSIFNNRSSKYKQCPTAEDYFEWCASEQLTGTRPRIFCHTKPLQTKKPFPHIFSRCVSADGHVLGKDRGPNENVQMTSLLTSWNCGPSAGSSIQELQSKSAKLKIGKLPRLLDTGTEEDDWNEAVERLRATSDKFHNDD